MTQVFVNRIAFCGKSKLIERRVRFANLADLSSSELQILDERPRCERWLDGAICSLT
jgi:hypothetical protein